MNSQLKALLVRAIILLGGSDELLKAIDENNIEQIQEHTKLILDEFDCRVAKVRERANYQLQSSETKTSSGVTENSSDNLLQLSHSGTI
jgi:hypothetical protein